MLWRGDGVEGADYCREGCFERGYDVWDLGLEGERAWMAEVVDLEAEFGGGEEGVWLWAVFWGAGAGVVVVVVGWGFCA